MHQWRQSIKIAWDLQLNGRFGTAKKQSKCAWGEVKKNRVALGTHWLCGGRWRGFSGTSAQIAFVLMYQWQWFHVCPPGQWSSTRAQNVSWQCPLRGGFYEWFHNTCAQWKRTNYTETELADTGQIELRSWSPILKLTCLLSFFNFILKCAHGLQSGKCHRPIQRKNVNCMVISVMI